MTRGYFSLSQGIKNIYDNTSSRESLCDNLSLHYQDALYSTTEEPYKIELDDLIIQMCPTRNNSDKIRVTLAQEN